MKKFNKNKLIATLGIITVMATSIVAYAGTHDDSNGSNYEADFDFDFSEKKVYTINIINTHVTSLVDIQGTKEWRDADDQDGLRPDEIVVHLYANNEDTGLTATASEASNWIYSFKDMPEFENGRAITYSVKEDVPSGYSVSYETGD